MRSTSAKVPSISIACRTCSEEMKQVTVKPSIENTVYAYQCVNGHRYEIVTADREISQLYLDLASECFNKAVMAEQPAAEALRIMGRRYVTQAATLERQSLNSAAGVLRR
jgi:hypothetical protein